MAAFALLVAVAVALAALLLATTRPVVVPFAPDAANGHVEVDSPIALEDDDLPAIANMDPALREAMGRAAEAAASDGVVFQVTSGWRTARYQQWLLDQAVETYADEEVARTFVATPDQSSHVTGHAVDIGPLDAQLWLMERGAEFGICQIYSNERWHFEVATTPGGECPELLPDATADRRG